MADLYLISAMYFTRVNLHPLMNCGYDFPEGIAVITAITLAKDPEKATQAWLARVPSV